MKPGYFGLLQPTPITEEQNEMNMGEIDLVIVPGLGFVKFFFFFYFFFNKDSNGNRLGRGRGHYDQYIEKMEEIKKKQTKDMAHLIGLSYKEQIVLSVPCEEFDKKLDLVLFDDCNKK